MTSTTRYTLLALVLVAIVAGIWYLDSLKPPALTEAQKEAAIIPISTSTPQGVTPAQAAANAARIAQEAAEYPRAIDFVDPTGFINTSPFSLKSLIGNKVILIDFWTYSCINCVRTLPYLEAWYQKYKDAGLVIVGVHTPEFDFEKDISNVTQATVRYGITYPVVLDSNDGTWNAYGNQYWPEDYLINIDGFIVANQIGEGNYAQTEEEIQTLLAQRNQVLGLTTPIPSGLVSPAGVVVPTQSEPLSPETYFGSNRNEFFGNGAQAQTGTQTLTTPQTLEQNTLYLSGTWDIEPQYAENKSAGATITYEYQAQNVYMVAAGDNGESITAQVLIDRKPIPASMRGSDVDGNGLLHIQGDRLYHVVGDSSWGQHTLEIIPQTPGLQVYTFTFG